MAKYLKVLFLCLFVIGFNRSVQAQAYYRDITLKESLVNVLYQYGKETYYRGIDPQGASFVFQRVLVLDCHHQGAQAFLDKIHYKYPEVSIRIQGCSDVDSKTTAEDSLEDEMNKESDAPGVPSFEVTSDDESAADDLTEAPQAQDRLNLSTAISKDYDQLRKEYQELQGEITSLEKDIKKKDSVIAGYKEQLSAHTTDQSASYASIAEDQKDLIRIQQSNLDYLKSELAEAKQNQAVGAVLVDDEKYNAMHHEIADSHLTAEEKQMDLNAKDAETKTLQAQLEDLEEQLRLIQEIVNQKNALIQSLEEEIKSVKPVDK